MLMNKIKPVTIILAIFAAGLYNIWPLGYLLDPNALHNSYISVLEVTSKPYAWLFVLTDILSGVCVLAIGFLLIIKNIKNRKYVISYILFGIATLFDAIIPIASKCEERISACGIALSQIISPHDIASILEAITLIYCLSGLLHLLKVKQNNYYKMALFTLWLLCLTGLFLIISVVINNFTTLSQTLYILMNGVGLVIIPISLIQNDN